MRLVEIFVLLRARWRLAIVIWLLVIAAAGTVTMMKEQRYTASASVVLDVKSPDPIAGMVLPGMMNNSYMGTQLGVLKSERVALRVAQALGWDKDDERRQRWQAATGGVGTYESALAGALLRDMDAVPTRESNVITLSYTDVDPVRAATIANAWVQAYIDITLELRVEPARKYAGFFDTHGKQLREDLERAQARLSEYQRTHAMLATDERMDIENSRLQELSTQVVMLQGLANETSGRQSQIAGNASSMPEVLSNPVIVGLTSELARQEARRTELAARLGDRHPEMVELNAKIAEIRTSIDNETRRVASGISVNSSVNRTRLAQAQAALEEQRNKLLSLKAQRDEAAVLLRDVDNAKRAYDTVMARASQTSVESHATLTNVSVLKEASAPLSPSEPKVVLNMAIAFIAATLLAVAAALGTEMRDRRLRTEQDIARILRVPVLGVLPERVAGKQVRTQALRGRWAAQIASMPGGRT